MTRRPFGGTAGDFVESVDAAGIVHTDVSVVCTLWSAQNGGSRITDLQDTAGNVISSVTADVFGQIPQFMGPNDGSNSLWIQAGSGPTRQLVFSTDTGTRLNTLETGLANVVVSGTATLSLNPVSGVYVFTGSSATAWALPAIAGNTGLSYWIKNRGSAVITLSRAGSDNLYDTASRTSITIAAGALAHIVNDGTYWLSL